MSIKNDLQKKKCIGKWVYFHSKDNKKHEYRGIITDEVIEISNDYAHRLQKIVWCQERYSKKKEWKEKKKCYSTIRACYYVITSNGKSIGFGQFCMNSHPNIVGNLFRKANKKGFFKRMSKKQIKKELKRFIEK